VEALNVPVIGGGGVSDGRGLVALLALGADAVIMGTRLLLTKEAPIHDTLKQALINATELDTMLVMRSVGATHRVWANAAARRCAELEAGQADLQELLRIAAGDKARKMYNDGDIDLGILSCGQGVGMAQDIPTARELLDRIMTEATEISQKLAAN
jgi:nitronate monooxygenase